MRTSDVREQILEEHRQIQERLSEIEGLGRRILAGEATQLGPLRIAAEALLLGLLEHVSWEDEHLGPALRRGGAEGEARAEKLERDHREQRALLEHIVTGLEDQDRPPVVVARTLVDLVDALREDIREEEEWILDPRVLEEGAVDAETGRQKG